jgi:rRNA maturation RNase YbeY
MGTCTFSDFEVKSKLSQKRKLSTIVQQLIMHYTKKTCSMSYVFVTDEYLHDMNKQYLNHDTYTDIITFDLSEENTEIILGDIYISIDRVKENAAKQSVTYHEELLRVILHGALHLSGFGDKTSEQKAKMRQLEELWMKKYLSLT